MMQARGLRQREVGAFAAVWEGGGVPATWPPPSKKVLENQTSLSRGVSPAKKASMFSTTRIPIALRVSWVALPR